MKRSVAVLFLLAFAFLGVNLWRGMSSSKSAPAEPEGAAEAPRVPEAALTVAREPLDEREAAPAAPVAEAATEANAPSESNQLTKLGGAFLVRQRDGSERAARTGTFELIGLSAEGVELARRRADAEHGRWSVLLEPEVSRRIRAFTLGIAQADGRLLPVLTPVARTPIPNDGVGFDVVLREPEASVLRVVDAATGRDLSGIEARRAEGGLHLELDREQGRIASDLVSPLNTNLLRQESGRAVLLNFEVAVRAPGYAWQAVELDLIQGGERTVELHPGGDVEIRFTGAPVPPSASLWISAAATAGESASVSVDLPVRGRSNLVLGGLRVLDFEAVLHVGELYDPAGVLANAKFRVVAGQRTTVEVQVEPPQEIVRAGLSGVALVPPALRAVATGRVLAISQPGNRIGEQAERQSLECSWEAAPADDTTPAVLRFEAKDLAVGTYALAVEGTGFSQTIELPPEGLHGLRLELGAPCEVVLDVVDAATGERIPQASVNWSVAEDDTTSDMTAWVNATRGEDGFFRALAPAGHLRWLVAAEGYGEPEERGAWIRAERHELKLRLPRQCALEFELVDGDVHVPFPQSWLPELEPLGHDGAPSSFSFGSTTRVIGVTRPGLYRITLPPVNGFRPPAAVEIDVAAGERKLVRIQLERY